MSKINLYLSAEERVACTRALETVRRWVQGDVGVFAELADAGILLDRDGKPLSLSKWSTIVEPALTEYARLVAGTTPGIILDVHDPATHPLGATALKLNVQLQSIKVSRRCTSLAAMPKDMQLHRTADDAFDVYKKTMNTDGNDVVSLFMPGLTAKQVLAQSPITESIFKFSFAQENTYALMRVLDTYSRVVMNQWENIKELTDDRFEGRRDDWHYQVEKVVQRFKEPWTGYSMNASSGIHSQKIHADAKCAWNVYKSLRHWSIVQRQGYSQLSVSTDMPMLKEVLPLVDSDLDAGLSAIPLAGGMLYEGTSFHAVPTFFPGKTVFRASLASSHSPVSLLNGLTYIQANPGVVPSF